jgi:hypothetical protein
MTRMTKHQASKPKQIPIANDPMTDDVSDHWSLVPGPWCLATFIAVLARGLFRGPGRGSPLARPCSSRLRC